MANSTIDVTIVIVCWNSSSYIHDCLKSIYENTVRISAEIIVVDNHSTDATVSIVKRNFPAVRIIQAGGNVGFPKANNLALSHAQGRYVLLLNPDTCFKTDVLSGLTTFLDEHPETGAVCPKIYEADGSVSLQAIRDLPSLRNAILTQFGVRKMFPGIMLLMDHARWQRPVESPTEVPFIAGAAIMIPKAIFTEVGHLDEQLPMYFEDIDLCARIRRIGRSLYVIPSAEIVHMGGKSADLSPVRSLLFALENGQAPWLFMKTYYGIIHAAIFTFVILVANALRLSVLPLLMVRASFQESSRVTQINIQLVKAAALLRWAVTGKKNFPSRLSGIFS